jgi:anti-sigma B factor antagonist
MTIASQPFAVEVTSGASGLVVRLAGELDLATVPDLDACLAALDADIVVDMAAVTFMDSTGLDGLIVAHKQAAQRCRSFVLRSPTEQVTKVLRATGVDQVLTVEW